MLRSPCMYRLAPRCCVALVLGLLAGCHSLDRMIRVSPFSPEIPDEDRVNLFPLAYWDGHDGTAILWPLADFDSHGYAIRPLVHKEDSVFSVAFPLSQWDFEERRGWVGPFYRFDEYRGLFPLVQLGDTGWVGPVWRSKSEHATSRGVFPIAKIGGAFSYVGPAWWTREDVQEGEDPEAAAVRSWGFFPLFAKGDFSHVGPYYRIDADGEGGSESAGLFPLLHQDEADGARDRFFLLGLGGDRKTDTSRQSWAFPLWYRTRHADRDEHVLLPFFYYDRKGSDKTLVTPLGGRGWSDDGSDRFVNILGPLYHHSHSESRSTTSFLWPLFERRTEGDSVRTRVAPLFQHRSNEDGNKGWFAAGLGAYRNDDAGTAWRLWPLASRSVGSRPDILYALGLFESHDTDEREMLRLTPLFFRSKAEDERALSLLLGLTRFETRADRSASRILPLYSYSEIDADPDGFEHLSLVARHEADATSYFHVGTTLGFCRSHRADEAGTFTDTWLLGLLHAQSSEQVGRPIPDPRWPLSDRDRTRHSRHGFFFDWLKFETASYRRWSKGGSLDEDARNALFDTQRYPPDADHAALIEAYDRAREVLARHEIAAEDRAEVQVRARELAATQTFIESRTHTRIPLLFEYVRDGDARDWDALLGLVQSKRDEQSSRFRVLYALYRSETDGDRTSRDLFPFVTWDSAPNETTFSFIWRVFRYKNEDGRTSGHLFFIPWGG